MKLVRLVVLMLALLAAAGCKDEGVDTYTIARKGVILQDEDFEVIHVYGFVNNRDVADQITEFLDKSEPQTYYFYRKRGS